MWQSRTKTDLIIEVWEKLDCESVGAAEIEAIETVVLDQFGKGAVESPMRIARLLADEGAELRHAEIMGLYLARASDRPYEAALRSVIEVSDLRSALTSIRKLENLRRKYRSDDDRDGLRHVRESAVSAKDLAAETASRQNIDPVERLIYEEIAQWFRVWLQTPEAFDGWVGLRQDSRDFIDKFGHIRAN